MFGEMPSADIKNLIAIKVLAAVWSWLLGK